MIAGIFHQGSGLGNQLHRYVATRVLALDKGYEFGMDGEENFKGKSFMNIELPNFVGTIGGVPVSNFKAYFEEKKVVENGIDVRGYDPEINLVEDNTIIDGEFQDPRYFMHRIDEVRKWLKVEPKPFSIPFTNQEDICVLNVRGGEYRGVADLFLPKEYWYNAMENMKKINPKMKFGVVTDDIALCQEWFPNFPIRHDEGDWSAIKEAHYLILSNSSFAILPALLNQNAKKIIAPLNWARHNIDVWSMRQNKYPQFTYQDRQGNLHEVDN